MKGNVGTPTSRNDTAEKAGLPKVAEPKSANPKAIEELKKLLSEFSKTFQKEADEAKNYLEEMKDHLESIEKAKQEKREAKEPKPKDKKTKPVVSKAEQVMSKQMDNLTRHATKKGSLYTHDIYLAAKLTEVVDALRAAGHSTEIIADATGRTDKIGMKTNATLEQVDAALRAAGVKAIAKDPTTGVMDPTEAKVALDRREKQLPKQTDQLTDLYKIESILQRIDSMVGTIEESFFGLRVGQEIFKGIVKEEAKFIQDTRAVAYEIQGVTKDMRGMQRAFENIGKTAATTGFDRSMFQKDFLKNLKRGISDLKTANKITTASLNTEKMLGLEAGALQDTFANWHQQLRMGDGQVAEMGRGLRDVARFTGLTGENLTKAVASSEELLKAMRNTATLSANTAKNIIEISAQAQKMGVDMGPLMKGMTNTNNLIREASQQTRALLINAAARTGRLTELMNGVVLKSKAGIKDMAKGLEQNLRLFGINSLEEIENLSEDAKMRLNLQLKAAFGVELGEMRQTIEALKEAGKTFGDRIQDINNKRKANLTLEEKAALAEEERKLKASKSLEVLTALDEAAKGANSMEQALAKFGTRRKEFEDDLNAMGISATDNADVARQALRSAVENVNAGLKQAGKQELKIDARQIEDALKDPSQFRELQATIAKAEQQAAVAQKAQLDPVNEIKQKVIEMNDTLRNMSSGIMSALMNSIFGKLALIATAVASVGTYLAMQGVSLQSSAVQLQNLNTSVDKQHGGWGTMLASAFGFGGKQPDDPAPGTGPTTPTPPLPPKDDKKIDDKKLAPAPAPSSTAPTAAVEKPAAAPAGIEGILNEMLAVLRRMADCVCKGEPAAAATTAAAPPVEKPAPEKAADAAAKEVKKGKMTPEQIAEAKAAGQARKQQQMKDGMDPAVAKSIQRKQMQTIKQDEKLAPAKKKEMLRDIKQGKRTDWMQKREVQAQKKGMQLANRKSKVIKAEEGAAKGGGPAAPPPTAPTEGWDIKSLMSSGPEMAQTAAAILVMAAGVVALGAAIVFLAHKVMKSFDLDIGKVMETAGLVGAVAVAGGAIVAASIAAINALEAEDTKSFVGGVQANIGELLRTAAAILIIGPAIVLLGAAIVGISQMILGKFNLNLSTTIETAAVVAAVGAAAAAILKGASEALEQMETMDNLPGAKKMMANPAGMAWTMIKGAIALLILGPAIVLLGAAIVKMSQMILGAFGLDASTAMKTGLTIAAVLIAAAIISGAVIGAMYGLFLLGKMSAIGWKAAGFIALGALALVMLTPLVVMLAAAIVRMSQAILGAFGLDAKTAAQVGLDVAAIMLSAAVIAGACVGAMYGLFHLGTLAMMGWKTAGIIALGALAMLVLVPAILLLAMAVIKMSDAILSAGEIDAKKAFETAKNVAALILGAGLIAGAVTGAMYGLYGLGILAKMLKKTWWLILLGAGALLLLTPAMLMLAQAILYMAQNLVQMDPAQVKEIVEKVIALMKGAAEISLAVLMSAGALSLLGLAMTTGTFWIAAALSVAGAAAILLMTPAMMQLAHAILEMGRQLTDTISLEDAKKIAEGVKGIFESAGVVSDVVLGQVGSLTKLGLMAILGGWIVGLMNMGAKFFFQLAQPVGRFVMSMLMMGKEMTNAMSMDEAKKIADGVKAIFDAAGVVAEQFGSVVSSLLKMGFVSLINIGGWITGLMNSGARFFFEMAKPIGGFVMSLLAMGNAMKNEMPPQKTKEIVEGVKGVFEAAGAVSDALTTQMGTLMKIGLLSWFKWLIPDLDKATEFFMSMAKPAMKFTLILVALGRILVASAGGPKKIKPLIEAIKGIAEIVEAVGKIMDVLIKQIVPMTRKKWFGLFGSTKLEQIADAAPQFEQSFESITHFIRFGIIRPIQRTVKNTAQVTKTIAVAKGLADIITAAGAIIQTISKVVLPMTRPGWFGLFGSSQLEKLSAAVPQFETAFGDIVHFTKNGIINPIRRAFKDCNKVKQVAGVAKAIAEAMNTIVPMMQSISKVVVGMTTAPSFLWFTTGTSTVDKLKEAMPKIDGVFAEIVGFVKNGLISPIQRAFPNLKKVQGTIQLAKAIGESVAAIAVVMDILANKLAPMADADQASWFEFWKSDKPDKITQIQNMIPKFEGPFRSMVNFLKNGLIGPVTQAFPNLKAVEGVLPIVKGVGEAITAIVGVLDALANKLLPMAEADSAPWYKFWSSDGPSKFEKLEQMKPVIEKMWNSLVYFVRDGLIYPVMRAFPDIKNVEGQLKTVKMVAEAVKSVAEVMETMQEIATTINPLSGLQAIFGQMDTTISPLERQIPMIQSMFLATTKFVQEGIVKPIASLNPQGLQGAVQRLKSMQQAMTIMQEMIEALEGMVGMTKGKPSVTTGMWWWKKTTEAIDPMTTQMERAIPIIQELFGKIVSFVQDGIVVPVSKLDGVTLKRTVKTLVAAAKAIEQVPPMIENLDEVMSMLSPGDYFNPKFPMDRIMMAKGWFENWFPKIAALIKDAIIVPVESNFKDASSVKKAAKIIWAVAIMLEKLPSVLENLDNAMSMMSPGDKLNLQYPMDRIMTQAKWWKEWFPAIGKLIKETIIEEVTKSFGNDVKKIKTAAKILMAVAVMIESLPKVLEGLDKAMGMMSPGDQLDLNYPMDRIMTQKKWFEKWFPAIAKFVQDAIMNPVTTNFKDVKNVKNVAQIMKSVACMISALPLIIKNLDDAMSMMSPGDKLNLNFPMDRIMVAMKWYRPWFESIAKFVRTAIVDVVTTQFNDIKSLIVAGKAMKAVACIIAAIPPVIRGLDAAMSLMSPGDQLDLSFPMDRIMVARKWFEQWFPAIADFVKKAIVDTIVGKFDGKELLLAAKLMRAMTTIITSVPKIINGLSNAMKLMGEGGAQAFDDDFPMDRIMMYKEKFADWFEKIAIFMRDGIVRPIIDELPNVKEIVMAARLMRAMATIITMIPKVIMGVANGLIPLVDSGMDPSKTAPAEKIDESKDEFAVWFRKVAIFMRDGIVDPIMSELPDVKTIVMAARVLRAMSTIVSAIPVIIRNLSRLFGPLTPDACLSDSPIAVLAANTEIFADWFRKVAAFLRDAIITPIQEYFPDPKEVMAVRQSMGAMIAVIRTIPLFLRELSMVLAPMMDRKFMSGSPIQLIGSMVIVFADWFFAISDALISGIIAPIVNYFPEEQDLEEVFAKMRGMSNMLFSMPSFLQDLNDGMVGIYESDAWSWGNKFRVQYFAAYFASISEAMANGIIAPVYLLPPSEELSEMVARLTEMGRAINAVSDMLNSFSTKLGPLANGWWWYSPEMSDLGRRVQRFSGFFAGVGNSLNLGIIDPIRDYLPDSAALREVTNTITTLSEVIGEVAGAIEGMAEAVAKLNSIEIVGIDEQQMIELAQVFQDLGVLSEAAKIEIPTAQVTPSPEEGSYDGPWVNNSGGPATPNNVTPGSSEEEDSFEKRFQKMVRRHDQRMAEKQRGTPKEIKSSSWSDGEDPSAKVIEQKLQKKGADAQKRTSGAIDELATNANKQTGIFTSDLEVQRLLSESLKFLGQGKGGAVETMANSPGGIWTPDETKTEFASPISRLGETLQAQQDQKIQTARPTSNWRGDDDVQRRVQQEKVSSQTPQSGPLPELGKIAASAQQEADNSARIVELLTTLVNYMKPSSGMGGQSNAGIGDTQTKYTVTSPPRYYKWNTGKHNQVAGKGVTNIGSTSY